MTRTTLLLLGIVSGCGTDGGQIDPPADPPGDASPLERCLAGGGALHELWATGNQHGAVTSIAVASSTVVLGSEDGSVKQWNLAGSSASYGTPFLDDTGIVVDALAFSTDGQVLGADRRGRVSEWRVSDAQPMRTMEITSEPLAAIAVSEHADLAAVALGSSSPEVRVITRATGSISAPLATTLWGVRSVLFGHGRKLFTAGHWYGVPMIERRSTDAPGEVISEWSDMALAGHVHAIAVNSYATRMAAAGDDFIAVLDVETLDGDGTIVHPVADHRAIGVAMTGPHTFATVGAEGTLRLWNLATAEPIGQLEIAEPIGLGVDASGEHIFTSGPDGDLHAYGCR
jgi:WD40 repeat protein